MRKSGVVVVLGSGVIYKKIIKTLAKTCHVYGEIPKKKKIDYIFCITEKPKDEQFKGIRAKLLFVIPNDQIINARDRNSLDIRVVKSPLILFKNQTSIPRVYLKKCTDIIMGAMFGSNTQRGLFILPEPPFSEPTQQTQPEDKKIILLKTFPLGKIVLFFIALLTIPIIITLIFILVGFYSLVLFQDFYLSGQIEKSETLTKTATFSFNRAQELNRLVVFPVFSGVLSVGGSMSQGFQYLSGATKKLEHVFRQTADFNSVRVELLAAQEEFVKTRFLLSTIKTDNPFFDQKIKNLDKNITSFTVLFNRVNPLLGVSAQILGVNSKKTYLILLQNSMELRATGGFIGSYGIASFENGQLLDFSVFDVYSADGQLKGHVEPPLPIKKYLEQPHWYLRDSNWDPDFEVSASRAAWFLEKEIGLRVDGVIGIDTYFISGLLEAIGDVYLPDYKDTITKDNLPQRANYWAHKDFFAGSTAKSDFLSTLARSIFDKLENDKNISWSRVFLGLVKGIDEKHLMFVFLNPQTQRVISQNGLSGSASDGRENKEGNLNDFLMVVDSNFGVNKVNYFVQRKTSQEVTINEEGLVTEFLKIDYINSSQNQNYKNYLRVVTPKGTVIKKAEIDGEGVGEINVEEVAKTTLGFLVSVPAKTQKTIKIEYELVNKMPISKGANIYSLKILKQAGTVADAINLIIKYPNFLTVGKIDKPELFRVLQAPKVVNIIGDLSKDRQVDIEFLSE